MPVKPDRSAKNKNSFFIVIKIKETP